LGGAALVFSRLRQQIDQFIVGLDFRRIRLSLTISAGLLILLVGFVSIRLDSHEYVHYRKMVDREGSNLLLAFEENVRRDLVGVDEILRELRNEYTEKGQVSSSALVRMQRLRSLPLIHISVTDARGNIVNSTRTELLGMDVSAGEYFQHFQRVNEDVVYLARPVIGKKTQQWLFHISRRLNKPDGSFGGTVTAGIDPAYFGRFYQKMQLGQGFSVSIVGLDGFIRVRQTAEKLDVGTDIGHLQVFQLIKHQKSGSYTAFSVLDQIDRIYTYRVMPEYPLVLFISVPEQEAFAEYYRLRDRYWLVALLGTLSVALFFALLMRLLEQQEQSAYLLRQMNRQLQESVAQRTEELEAANMELQIIAMMDGLTGIANRRYFDDYYERSWRTAIRMATPISVVMADIDWFKAYNDTYGHQAGDDCLKQVARTVRNNTKRAADFAARYGGEEFIVVLPDTDIDGANKFAERVRGQVEALDIEHGKSPFGKVTVSLGVASIKPGQSDIAEDLIESADKALYKAKHDGKNCVR
jgi:diguanylate cyclase (GGDEF)-like protein